MQVERASDAHRIRTSEKDRDGSGRQNYDAEREEEEAESVVGLGPEERREDDCRGWEDSLCQSGGNPLALNRNRDSQKSSTKAAAQGRRPASSMAGPCLRYFGPGGI